jgi:steroid 5-alpha reductase family enzyme
MVSALVYVLVALSKLIESSGAVDLSFGLTALIIGSALLLLSAFWTAARRRIVGFLPGELAVKLPVVDRPLAA